MDIALPTIAEVALLLTPPEHETTREALKQIDDELRRRPLKDHHRVGIGIT
jgi:hypothetical protein